ncbi:MAG: hypothetical protein QG622_2244 [Actinomycetota bacterium]|nr:hypothetical protein [Actinomycetota bacterium]
MAMDVTVSTAMAPYGRSWLPSVTVAGGERLTPDRTCITVGTVKGAQDK